MYLKSPYISKENRLRDVMQFWEEFEATCIFVALLFLGSEWGILSMNFQWLKKINNIYGIIHVFFFNSINFIWTLAIIKYTFRSKDNVFT